MSKCVMDPLQALLVVLKLRIKLLDGWKVQLNNVCMVVVSKVGVKSSKLVSTISDYDISPNYQCIIILACALPMLSNIYARGVCEESNVLAEINGIFNVDDALRECDSEASCVYFTMSTSAGTGGMPNRMQNKLWLCSGWLCLLCLFERAVILVAGEPVLARHLSWISGVKRSRGALFTPARAHAISNSVTAGRG